MTNLTVLCTSNIDSYGPEISNGNRALELNLYQGTTSKLCRTNWEIGSGSQRKGFSNQHSVFDASIYDDTLRSRTRHHRLGSKNFDSKSVGKPREKQKAYSPGQHLVLTLVRTMSSSEHYSANLRLQASLMLKDTITRYLGAIVNIESAWKQQESVFLTDDGLLKEPFARGICTRFPIHTKHFGRFLDALTMDLIRHLSLGGELSFAHGKITVEQIGEKKELILKKIVPQKSTAPKGLKKNNAKLLKVDGFTLD